MCDEPRRDRPLPLRRMKLVLVSDTLRTHDVHDSTVTLAYNLLAPKYKELTP